MIDRCPLLLSSVPLAFLVVLFSCVRLSYTILSISPVVDHLVGLHIVWNKGNFTIDLNQGIE